MKNIPQLPNENSRLLSDVLETKEFIGYCADTEGFVYSCKTNKKGVYRNWVKLAQFDSHNGYKMLRIYGNASRGRRFFVHRIIAYLFLRQRNENEEVNHIDANKENNRATNLEWVTKSQNLLHASAMGMLKYNRGEKHGLAKLGDCDIPIIFQLKKEGIPQKNIAAKFCVSESTISEVLNRKKFKHVPI